MEIRYGIAAVVRPSFFLETVYTVGFSAEGIHPGSGKDGEPLPLKDDNVLVPGLSDEFMYENLAYRQCDCVIEPVGAKGKTVLRLSVF